MKLKRKATNAAYGWTGRHVQNAFMDMIAISIDVKDIDTTRGKLNLHLRSIRHKSMTQRPLIPLIYALFYNYLLVQPPSDLQPPSLSESSREVGGMRRRGAGAEEDCCSIPAFTPCRAWWGEAISAEEAEYLVPEANIRLRPVEEYPLGPGSRGQLCVAAPWWHTRLVALYHTLGLYLLLRRGQVCLLLTHSVSSQPVLCHRTHGKTQRGSDIVVQLHHPLHRQTGGGGGVWCCRLKIELLLFFFFYHVSRI